MNSVSDNSSSENLFNAEPEHLPHQNKITGFNSADEKIKKKMKGIKHPFKEAESLNKHKIKLERRGSAHELGKGGILTNEKDELAKKSGTFWEAVSRTPEKNGGYLYTFKLRDDLNNVTKESDLIQETMIEYSNHKIFPAIEYTGLFAVSEIPDHLERGAELLNKITEPLIENLDPSLSPEKREQAIKQIKRDLIPKVKPIIKIRNALSHLGYKCTTEKDGSVQLTLPDREAFLVRWEKLREENPDLPSIDLAAADGIASDMDFIEAYFTHDVLLSSNKEFLHDHMYHVIPLVYRIIESNSNRIPSYKKERFKVVKLIAEEYSKIQIIKNELKERRLGIPENDLLILEKHIDKFESALGALTDVFAAINKYENSNDMRSTHIEKHFYQIWNDPQWEIYFKNKFADETFDANLIISIRRQVNEIIEIFHKLRS